MLMSAGIAIVSVLVAVAVVAIVGFTIQAIADAAADEKESRRLYAEKAARRARYERLAGLHR